MTREEARLTLQENLGMLSFMFSRRISEAIKVALEVLSQPSFPSNLDEAEFEYSQSLDGIPANQEEEKMIYDAFKAGAKWMAEQGETQEHFVIGSIAGSPCGPAVVCYTEEFAIGDKVIVQIKKK